MQLSAFAAARAKRKFAEVESCAVADTVNGSRNSSGAQEERIESNPGAVLLHEDINQDIQLVESPDPSSDLSEDLEHEQQKEQKDSIATDDIFCTWKPTSTNYERIDSKTQRMRLRADDTLCFIGDYGLLVEAGSLSLYGANLEASSKVHAVFAPSTHDLPVIKCLSNNATAVLSSLNTGIHDLGCLSPLFGKIWTVSASDEVFGEEAHRTSFEYVSCLFRI